MINPAKALLAASLISLLPLAAGAEPPAREWAQARLTHGLLKPLNEKDDERSKFSRVIQPPRERRVRVLSPQVAHDEKGRGFLTYAIDVRYGEDWRETLTGCVYRKTGKIYVALDDEFRPAEYLLGEDVAPVKGVCVERRAPEPRA